MRVFLCGLCLFVTLILCEVPSAVAQTEVLTVQGNLPRLNYRDTGGNLIWAMPANSVLWKLDGPFHAGVVVVTAASPSGSININEGGVSIRGNGFPSAKLHVGTLFSATQPGEVRVDPGNPAATATIHAVNASLNTIMTLETQSASNRSTLKFVTPNANFSHFVGFNFAIRDENNLVNPLLIIPSNKNNNAIVIKSGFVGLGTATPTSPLELANGAKCTAGGVWTNASSRELKKDIEALDADKAKAALAELQPVTYRYKAEPDEVQVGFIAEDVPDLVATKTRKELSPMDMVAVLTKVVQDQQSQLDQQAKQLKAQSEAIERQQKMLEQLLNK